MNEDVFENDVSENDVCENNIKETEKPGLDEDNAEDIEILDAAVEKPKNDYDELYDRYQRTLAEFDNFRKRTMKEKAAIYDNGVNDTVEKLLPILDNFSRALSAWEDKENTFYQGIEMIARQLDNYLTDLNVDAIESKGAGFDHNLHYAVAHVEDAQYGQNEIIEELQKGYTYKGKVIRPSMVKVAN